MTIQGIYFDGSNLAQLGEWLASRPKGDWKVLIGNSPSDDGMVPAIKRVVMQRSPGAVRWLEEKFKRGTLIVKCTPDTHKFPEGVPLSLDEETMN